MKSDPVLAAKTLPPGDGYKVSRTMKVEGGLHYIRGNQTPYFSLTCTTHRKGLPNQCYGGGAAHEFIVKHFPRFADLAKLHLCGIDGAPMHAVENGWYNLAGALKGAGERFHVGNSKRNFPITPPVDKPWMNTEYRWPTEYECLQIFADHCRISIGDAERIADRVAEAMGGIHHHFQILIGSDESPRDAALKVLRFELDAMRPRWKAEAEACIAQHGLLVYGDPWPEAA